MLDPASALGAVVGLEEVIAEEDEDIIEDADGVVVYVDHARVPAQSNIEGPYHLAGQGEVTYRKEHFLEQSPLQNRAHFKIEHISK